VEGIHLAIHPFLHHGVHVLKEAPPRLFVRTLQQLADTVAPFSAIVSLRCSSHAIR
jgi:hypothetical protein